MELLVNTVALKPVFVWSMIISAVCLLCTLVIYRFFTKKNTVDVSASKNAPDNAELLQYPENKTKKPITPSTFTLIGVFGFLFAFGLCGLCIIEAGLPHAAILLISVCIGLAAEVALSMLKYAHDIRKRDDIVFVPRTVNMSGVVYKDIPAGKTGCGYIRMYANNGVFQIKARSVDEVILTAGTEVKILYADSDSIVVVERNI